MHPGSRPRPHVLGINKAAKFPPKLFILHVTECGALTAARRSISGFAKSHVTAKQLEAQCWVVLRRTVQGQLEESADSTRPAQLEVA